LNLENLYFIPLAALPPDLNPHQVQISSSNGKQMTGYAPVFKPDGTLQGVMAADASVNLLEKKFQESVVLVILSASLTIALMIATLYFLAGKLSKPIQRLNNSALSLAAGHYGESLAVKGPKEITELANTLNTMSECLLENINRVKENSLLRERMYGEYECAMLLQHLMLQKNIDNCHSDAVAVKSLTLFSDSPRGLLLNFPKPQRPDLFHIHMAEAEEDGFEGMYELLTQYKHSPETHKQTSLIFDRSNSLFQSQGSHLPLFWSLDHKQFLEPKEGSVALESGDFFFLFNGGLLRFFKGTKAIQDLIAKVLKIFAQEGLETTASMLQKELAFAAKRKELAEDIHLLCFQILNP
jgi:HAMP domain-containing protein